MILPEYNYLKHISCEYNYLTNVVDLEILSQNEENRILYQEQNVPEGASFFTGIIIICRRKWS